ncbi:Tfx family DNA-binding protein [Methanoregula sp.]|uniref:Tfx family DNA-binding protein n=1 Tax=Methanoregula sp. TaxID=2052170 RepID=UPI002604313A|nr:Tfx family DNA-binding protein [Methanoregula sp.]MDD5144454.1 Tfx family DNA-binding protein [Methanoregula sp.]
MMPLKHSPKKRFARRSGRNSLRRSHKKRARRAKKDRDVKHTILSKKMMEVLRYRKQGMTLGQIAEIYGTSRADICVTEKRARQKIMKAMITLNALRFLDVTPICTFRQGSDLMDVTAAFYAEMAKRGIPLPEDPMELINRLRSENTERIHGRLIKKDIDIYLLNDGEIYSR